VQCSLRLAPISTAWGHLLIMRVISQLLQLFERLTSGQQQLNQTGDMGGMAA
jgi:hypothetical protein